MASKYGVYKSFRCFKSFGEAYRVKLECDIELNLNLLPFSPNKWSHNNEIIMIKTGERAASPKSTSGTIHGVFPSETKITKLN